MFFKTVLQWFKYKYNKKLQFDMPVKQAWFIRKSSVQATVIIYLSIPEKEVKSMHPAIKQAWRIGRNIVISNPHIDIQIPKYYQKLQAHKETIHA